MLEKIENRLNKGGRKQRGKKLLKSRVNITYPQHSWAICAKKDVDIRLEQLKQIRTDLTRLLSGQYQIIFTRLPNKPFTKKGLLVRMGKGKGKIDHFSCNVKSGTVCIILVLKDTKAEIRETIVSKFEKKYPFLTFKKYK